MGTPVADPNKPLEVVRTIHSFDPCMACAVHVVDARRQRSGFSEGSVMRILVLGVGNILLTDEAIGVRIVEALEQRYILPDYVEILDGGTAGMELLGDMANRDHLIIADAIVSKKSAPGTMMILRDEEVPALFTNKISPHQAWPGRRVVGPALHRRVSKKLTLVGVIPESLEPHIGLTPTVEAMIEPALEQVLAALRESGVEAIPREAIHD